MIDLSNRWLAELQALAEQGRDRRLRAPFGHDFSSNDYLGYGARVFSEPHPLPRGATASRLLRGQHPIWDIVEERLAGWHGAPATLIFNSGYVANEGLLSTIIGPGDWVASDQFNHASIIDGLRLAKAERFVFPHGDLQKLSDELTRVRHSSPASRALFVVTESLFGMDGDIAPLVDLVDLAEKHGAQVIVDEAHATGCFGPQGSGLVDELGLRGRVLATVHTGGKALGVPGAYVAGPTVLRDYLVNRCRHFIFTTALPPQVGRWWKDALDRAWHDEPGRRRLHALARSFREALGSIAGGSHYIVPIVVGDDTTAVAAAERLQAAGFDVRAIRPPTVPAGTARLRVSIHSDHEAATVAALADAIRRTVS